MPRVSLFTYAIVVVTFLASAASACAEESSKTHTFRSRRAAGTIDKVKLSLEVSGELVVMEDGKLKRLKTNVVANLGYDERFLAGSSQAAGPIRSARWYETASADMKIEQDSFKPALSDGHRLVVVQVDGKSATLFSPKGPLTREELDLLDLQGDSLLLDRLLPDKPVAVGDQWSLTDELLIALLRLDEVSKTEVVAKLAAVRNDDAIMELSGKVSGATGGVTTEIELKGKYRFNAAASRIDWAAFLIRENRSIGHVGPGLDMVARLQAVIIPESDCDRLSDAALENLTLEPTSELTQLVHKPGDGQWQFTYDRRWFITAEEKDHLVLRLVDRGELVAQCNIATLAKVPVEKLISLSGFQQDIQRALGKNFGQFLDASQRANAVKYRVYRVAVEGEVQELPIQWVYHLVADQHGRQASFVFTIEKSLMERFGQADEPLVETLRFVSPEVALHAEPGSASRQ